MYFYMMYFSDVLLVVKNLASLTALAGLPTAGPRVAADQRRLLCLLRLDAAGVALLLIARKPSFAN